MSQSIQLLDSFLQLSAFEKSCNDSKLQFHGESQTHKSNPAFFTGLLGLIKRSNKVIIYQAYTSQILILHVLLDLILITALWYYNEMLLSTCQSTEVSTRHLPFKHFFCFKMNAIIYLCRQIRIKGSLIAITSQVH